MASSIGVPSLSLMISGVLSLSVLGGAGGIGKAAHFGGIGQATGGGSGNPHRNVHTGRCTCCNRPGNGDASGVVSAGSPVGVVERQAGWDVFSHNHVLDRLVTLIEDRDGEGHIAAGGQCGCTADRLAQCQVKDRLVDAQVPCQVAFASDQRSGDGLTISQVAIAVFGIIRCRCLCW
jgi:hypothetical protein